MMKAKDVKEKLLHFSSMLKPDCEDQPVLSLVLWSAAARPGWGIIGKEQAEPDLSRAWLPWIGGYGAIIVIAEMVMWPANPGTMGFTPGCSKTSAGAASVELTGGNCCVKAPVRKSHCFYFMLFAVFEKLRVVKGLFTYSVYELGNLARL